MKKLLINTFVLLAAGLVACSKSDGPSSIETAPSVSVEVLSRSLTSVTVKFVPSDNTTMYKFALGNEFDRDNFLNDDIIGTVVEVSNNPVEYTFDGLESSSYYVIYAVAYNSNNETGPVTSRGIQTMNTDFVVTQKYFSDDSAGFFIECSTDYYTWSCALGTADDRDAFLDNLMPGISTFDEDFHRQVNYFDLQKGTDYVFYCIGYDRAGRESNLFEIAFTTYDDSDSFPNFDITIGDRLSDFLYQSYDVQPNSLVSSMLFFAIEPDGYYDYDVLDGEFSGVIDEAVLQFTSGVKTIVNGMTDTYSFEAQHETQGVGAKQRAYVVTYDLNGDLAHIKRFDSSTPAFDATLLDPKRSDISFDIINTGSLSAAVKVSYPENSGIVAYYIDLITVATVDEIVENYGGELNDAAIDYIYTLVMTQSAPGFVYRMPDATSTYSNSADLVDMTTEWYWVIIPMNANGTASITPGGIALSPAFTCQDGPVGDSPTGNKYTYTDNK